MEHNTRKPGYYRVKYSDSWIIAEWTGRFWYLPSLNFEHSDMRFEQIDETPIDPAPSQPEDNANTESQEELWKDYDKIYWQATRDRLDTVIINKVRSKFTISRKSTRLNEINDSEKLLLDFIEWSYAIEKDPDYALRILRKYQNDRKIKPEITRPDERDEVIKAFQEIADMKAISALPEHLHDLIVGMKRIAKEQIESARKLKA